VDSGSRNEERADSVQNATDEQTNHLPGDLSNHAGSSGRGPDVEHPAPFQTHGISQVLASRAISSLSGPESSSRRIA
jgi:hypothetical protein